MGGRGSGRTGGNATVERTDSIKLSIHDVMRGFDGTKPMGKGWSPGSDERGELAIIVSPRGPYGAEVVLKFNMRQFNRETGEQVQRIDLGWSNAHFGGKRWWWYCPRTNERVTKLYLPNGGNHFWSRQAYRLDYQSQRETFADRAQRRAERLCRKLGPDAADLDYYPKPKGMHWKTFNQICEKIEQANYTVNVGFVARVGRLMARYGDT